LGSQFGNAIVGRGRWLYRFVPGCPPSVDGRCRGMSEQSQIACLTRCLEQPEGCDNVVIEILGKRSGSGNPGLSRKMVHHLNSVEETGEIVSAKIGAHKFNATILYFGNIDLFDQARIIRSE